MEMVHIMLTYSAVYSLAHLSQDVLRHPTLVFLLVLTTTKGKPKMYFCCLFFTFLSLMCSDLYDSNCWTKVMTMIINNAMQGWVQFSFIYALIDLFIGFNVLPHRLKTAKYFVLELHNVSRASKTIRLATQAKTAQCNMQRLFSKDISPWYHRIKCSSIWPP